MSLLPPASMENATTKIEEKDDLAQFSASSEASPPSPSPKTAHTPDSSTPTANTTAPKKTKPDRKTIMFSLLLDPVANDEFDSMVHSEGHQHPDAALTSSLVKSLEVHTVLGNEQGLLDGSVDAKMDGPTGLSQSLDGLHLYFCEYGSHTVRQATLGGPIVRTVAGKGVGGFQDGPCSTARFQAPNGLCVLPTGKNTYVLIVADTGNNAVRCINLRTETVTTILCGGKIDPQGTRTPLSKENHGDKKVDNIDDVETNKSEDDDEDDDNQDDDVHIATQRPKALFSGKHFKDIVLQSPRGVCAAGKQHPGVFFVCDAIKIFEINLLLRTCRVLVGGGDLEANNGAGQRGHRDGSFRLALFDHPTGLAFDATNGHLYVADSHNHVIRLLYENHVTTIAGCGRAGYLDGYADGSARFKFPQKIAIDEREQRLFVSELNDVVRGVTLPRGDIRGRVWTMAGSGQPGRQDGAASTSTWQFPCGLYYSEAERILYCADSDNHCIRTIMTHDGWVLPLDAELYVQRAMSSLLESDVPQKPLSSSHSSYASHASHASHSSSLSSASSSASTSSSSNSTNFAKYDKLQTKFRRTLDNFIQKANKELEDINFAIFRTNYMLQHPSATVLLLAEALAVIVQDPELSRPELDQIDPHNSESKAHRMSIFRKRKKGSSLIAQLKITPVGQLSPRQVSKLIHCVQKLGRAQMSKAPDLHRLKKWVMTRCASERFILEHNVNSTPFPPQTMMNDTKINPSLSVKDLRDTYNSSINMHTPSDSMWNPIDSTGDPEVSSADIKINSFTNPGNMHNMSHNKINLLGLGAGSGAQRYAQLSYYEVCRENELLRRELDTMRTNSRLILDVLEGAIAAPGASANHLALHSILGVPSSQSTQEDTRGNVNEDHRNSSSNNNSNSNSNMDQGSTGNASAMDSSGSGSGSMAHHKFQRQARQASIIIEELERALGNSKEDGE